MTITTVTFGGQPYALETLGNLSGPELVKLHNNCATLVGQEPTKRFSDKMVALKRTWAVLQVYAAQNETKEQEDQNTSAPAEAPSTTASAAADTTQASEEETDMAKTAKKGARKARTTSKATSSKARGFAPEAKIHILVQENPRRGAAAERFKLYKEGMTVAKYCEKFEGGRSEALVHLRWDAKHGFIKVA